MMRNIILICAIVAGSLTVSTAKVTSGEPGGNLNMISITRIKEQEKGSKVDQLKKQWEQKAADQKKVPEKVKPVVRGTLGKITKECEQEVKVKFQPKYENECLDAEKKDKKGKKNKEAFYSKYNRDVSHGYKEKHKAMEVETRKAFDIRSDLMKKKLTPDSSCAVLSESLSLVHPINNDPFSETMACVHKKRDEINISSAKDSTISPEANK